MLFAQKIHILILQSSCSTLACSISKTKRKPTELDKIFATKASNKRLISKICKQLIQLNKENNKKMGGISKQTFLQR